MFVCACVFACVREVRDELQFHFACLCGTDKSVVLSVSVCVRACADRDSLYFHFKCLCVSVSVCACV